MTDSGSFAKRLVDDGADPVIIVAEPYAAQADDKPEPTSPTRPAK